VLSPFRAVARELEKRKRRFPTMEAGTVHRSQGREADIVILVLGGDPAQPGAKRWAAAKPNLVNVAVSRARRRIYVIGDHSSWSPPPHFNVLADHLPVSRDQPSAVRH
jgi:superfamily I DNA and/or RNA helicase